MSYQLSYTGNGSQRDFAVPPDYIRRAHIIVEVDETPVSSYVFFNDTTIRFDVAPANGAAIVITRRPPNDTPLNDFGGAAIISNTALNENFVQSIQLSSIAEENAAATLDNSTAALEAARSHQRGPRCH
jgi:hypothetical protein